MQLRFTVRPARGAVASTLLFAATLLLLGPAGARGDALYVGAGAYITDADVATGSESDVSPALFLGYQFLDSNFLMLSAEAGYYDLGAASGTVEDQRFSYDAQAYTLSGVAYFPLGPFFEIYGKAGVAMLDVETRFGDDRRSDDGSELFLGAGVALDFFDRVDVYLEYLQFDNQIDSQMLGLGVRFDFF